MNLMRHEMPAISTRVPDLKLLPVNVNFVPACHTHIPSAPVPMPYPVKKKGFSGGGGDHG
jgi:hypothetical protein